MPLDTRSADDVLPQYAVQLEDVETLNSSTSDFQTYISLYNAFTLPLKLPIPTTEPTATDKLIRGQKRKAGRPKKTAESRRSQEPQEGVTKPQERSPEPQEASSEEAAPSNDMLSAMPSGIAEQHTLLPLFGSADTRAVPGAFTEAEELHDIIFHTGGPVWALDWCPRDAEPDGQEAAIQHLVVGVHAKGLTHNPMGKRVSGSGILQLWQVQHRSQANKGPSPLLPHMVMGICHDRGVVWDCKWCPNPDAARPGKGDSLARLGLLAIVYGDGALEVVAVPDPSTLPARPAVDDAAGSSISLIQQPLLVHLGPKALAAPTALDSSLGSCVEWLPAMPHDLLLMGSWDGTVAIWRLPPESPGASTAAASIKTPLALELLLHFPVDPVPIRSVSWAPPQRTAAASDLAGRHIFLTAGHASVVKIWDARDPCQPAVEIPAQIAWIMSASWTHEPHGVLLCQDDGALRFLSLNPFNRTTAHDQKIQTTWWGTTIGTLWSLHVSPIGGHTAYAGDGGKVIVAAPQFQQRLRKRPAHIIVSMVRQENGVIYMAGQQPPIVPLGIKPDVRRGEVTDPAAGIQRVRWSCARSEDPQGTWLASAGANGIVRCQRISFYAVI